MPLSRIQRDALAALASRRTSRSFVAGAAPLTALTSRLSVDLDIFNDDRDAVSAASEADAATLEAAGFQVAWERRLPTLHTLAARRGGETTRLEWVTDSDYRFFPALPDPLFGYKLHLADIATNKALACAGRREPRDLIDLLFLHRRFLPLGAVVWAAVGKDPGFSPENLIVELRRNSRYQQYDFDDARFPSDIDAGQVSRDLREAAEAAADFVQAMPDGQEGLLYLADGRVVQPDPDRLDHYVAHPGSRGGSWPAGLEVADTLTPEPEPRR